jgi:hypothetical protein
MVLALLTLGLCWYTFHAWHQSRSARAQVALIQSEIDKLDHQRAEGIALLNQPQNREVANQSAFLNGLIARRSFSLTQLFMELERIMPARLHVTSIAPTLTKNNQIEIHMMVGGDAREQALELVRRLEDSPSFRQPELRSETLAQASPGARNAAEADRVQFDIALFYVPQAAPEQTGTDKSPDKSQPAAGGDKAVKRSRNEPKGPAVPAAGSSNANAAPSPQRPGLSSPEARGKGVAR